MSETEHVRAEGATKQGAKLSISIEELQAIVSAAVGQATEKSATMLAHAILEAKKPYIDPRHEENERTMREQMREQKQRIDAQIKADRDSCPHMQGCNALSQWSSPLTSIVWHQLDYGDFIGICTNCQRQFLPGDKDYFEWLHKKSANRPSQAGQRQFYDTAKVIERGRRAIGATAGLAAAA